MSQRLQTNDGSNAGVVIPDGSTSLVLDRAYCGHAIQLIRSAKTEIRLCAYAWRWYDTEPEIGIQKLNVELLRAVRRGVVVRCLVDTQAMQKTFTTLGFNARSVHPTRMLHTKAIACDLDRLLIGSHNLTKRANTDNYEASVLTADFEVCAQFATYFDKMWDSRG